jgi:hypothetical protein
MWILLMLAAMVLPEAGVLLAAWLLHRRRVRRGLQAVYSLAAELVSHCMHCGRMVRQGIGYCDVVCRHGYERRFSSSHWTDSD